MKIDEKLLASGGESPDPTRGSAPGPAGGSALDHPYRLALHALAVVRCTPLANPGSAPEALGLLQ